MLKLQSRGKLREEGNGAVREKVWKSSYFGAIIIMEEYGETLGRVHKLNVSAKPQVDRKFYHRPGEEMLKKLNLQFLSDYFDRKPLHGETVFCHGDFHYANVLWKDQHISAILDFELAGYGNRDFDIAWALFLRPGQRFLKTDKEQALFIKGYQKHGGRISILEQRSRSNLLWASSTMN